MLRSARNDPKTLQTDSFVCFLCLWGSLIFIEFVRPILRVFAVQIFLLLKQLHYIFFILTNLSKIVKEVGILLGVLEQDIN